MPHPNFLDIVFDFVSSNVHSDGVLLLFHANDVKIKTKFKLGVGDLNPYRWGMCRRATMAVGSNPFSKNPKSGLSQI
jgi:hypothetical protein